MTRWDTQCHQRLFPDPPLRLLNPDGSERGLINLNKIASLNAPKGKLRGLAPVLSARKLSDLPQCNPGVVSMIAPPPGWTVFGVNTQCVHNEVLALVHRMIVPLTCKVTPQLQEILQLLPHPSLSPIRGETLLEMFPKSRIKRYRRLLGKQYLDWSPTIKAFTKMERIPIVKRGTVKAPRLIQARHPEYNFLLAAFTKPLEHSLYRWQINGHRVIAKGLNLQQRASLLFQVWNQYAKPKCLALDCTNWDGHVSRELLQLEHQYYLQVFGNNPHLEHLLQKQLYNHGTTLCGVSYHCNGGRASGDMNTALGNCVLAASLALYAIRMALPTAIAERKCHVICDGDDTLIIGESEVILQVANSAPQLYASVGHALRVDGITDVFWQIEFCQHKPFRRSDGILVMVPNPRKVLQTSFMGTGHNAFSSAYFGTLWDQRSRVHTGVPVYDELFTRLAKSNSARLNGEHFFGFEHANPNLPRVAITCVERALFAFQWDFPEELQLQWEHACIEFRPDIYHGTPAQLGT